MTRWKALLMATALSAIGATLAHADGLPQSTWKGEVSRGTDGKMVVSAFVTTHTGTCGSMTSTKHAEIRSIIETVAAEFGLSGQLMLAMASAESAFNARAVSPKGAKGVLQLIDSTARAYGVVDSFNPEDNIRGGAKFIRYLSDRYNGQVPLILSGFNAGPGAVAKYGGIPPYKETVAYVAKVQARMKCLEVGKTA